MIMCVLVLFRMRVLFNLSNSFLFQSQVDTVLDKENYTLEELLDEDEIIQECKALNTRLISL